MILVIACGYILCHHYINAPKKKDKTNESIIAFDNEKDKKEILYLYTDAICKTMEEVSGIYNRMLIALYDENRTALKIEKIKSEEMYHKATEAKYGIVPKLSRLEEDNIPTAHFYVQVVDYI